MTTPTNTPATRRIQLGHSPDSDDAFMFYGLAEHKVDSEGFAFEHVLRDIQTLNEWAREGRIEITAISVHAYAYVADKYAILSHGASMGDNYGPIVVTREPVDPEWLRDKRIAIPGEMTSAFLALKLFLGDFAYDVMPFDQIMEAVASGKAEAGLLIHEGQLTHGELGLHRSWTWASGGIRRRKGCRCRSASTRCAATSARRRWRSSRASSKPASSMAWSIARRRCSTRCSIARGLETATADTFVGMYVNDWTVDMGERGKESIRLFLGRAAEQGYIPQGISVDFVE